MRSIRREAIKLGRGSACLSQKDTIHDFEAEVLRASLPALMKPLAQIHAGAYAEVLATQKRHVKDGK
jgi:hypothetical protein